MRYNGVENEIQNERENHSKGPHDMEKIVRYRSSFQDKKKKGHVFTLHTRNKMKLLRQDRRHPTAVKGSNEMKSTGNVRMPSCSKTGRRTKRKTGREQSQSDNQETDKTETHWGSEVGTQWGSKYKEKKGQSVDLSSIISWGICTQENIFFELLAAKYQLSNSTNCNQKNTGFTLF